MKLATHNDGSRDGQLLVVARDLKTCVIATKIAPSMQNLLDSWAFMAPQCEDLYVQLNQGRAANSFDFDPKQCMAPLPRAYQFADASAYVDFVELISRSLQREMPQSFWSEPLMHQAASDNFMGPCDDILVASEAWGIDVESEIAIITGDVEAGTTPAQAAQHIRLVMLANDVSLRELIPAEMIKGFGFLNSKPNSSFSPVAVTPDELGEAWAQGKVHLPLRTSIQGQLIGQPNAGVDMTFNFPQLISHLTKTRSARAGSIIGSGTVFNKQANKGQSSIFALRALEIIATGQASTPYLQFGDSIKIDMLDKNGKSIFGAIEQKIEQQA